eukprot:jgi/Picsp_1/5754/NSC_03113-R1_1-acyl-sn-glycerol-3-phosphate acyltransferase
MNTPGDIILRLPPFIFTLFCFTWSLGIFSLNHKIQWVNLFGKRNDVLGWAKGMKAIYRFRVLKVGDRDLYRGKAIYLCNHRSWADFMVDQYVTEGRTLFMSRWAVAYVFPLFMIPMWIVRAVLIFKRGAVANKVKFNKWIDEQWEKSTQTALGVYPEGHRSTDGKSLPLKRGMLHYAFDRQIPVQIVIGGNKEAILSEKKLNVGFGQTVTVGYSDVLYPEKFEDFEQFMTTVQATWDNEWKEIFSTSWEGLPELPDPKPFGYLPPVYLIKMLIISPLEITFLLYLSWKVLSKIYCFSAILGAFQWPAIGLMMLYLVVTFALAWRPPKNVFHIDLKENDKKIE